MATKAKEETSTGALETVTVKSANPRKAGLWDRDPAYKSVKGADRIVTDDGEGNEVETFEIFIRNEPVKVPRTSEVLAAINLGRLVEVTAKGDAKGEAKE